MEKDRVLGVITVPVTVENVAEDKKPVLPDEVWEELKEIIKSESTQNDLLGFVSIKDGGTLKRNATAVQQCIEHVFDCNPIAAEILTNTIIKCGKSGCIYDNDLPELFIDGEKWKRLDNMFLDLFQKHIIDVIRF